jgi:hypothetical protein
MLASHIILIIALVGVALCWVIWSFVALWIAFGLALAAWSFAFGSNDKVRAERAEHIEQVVHEVSRRVGH